MCKKNWITRKSEKKMKHLLKKILGYRGMPVYRGVRNIIRAKYIRTGYCNICGRRSIFCGSNAFTLTQKKERNDLDCLLCGANARSRGLLRVILDLYDHKVRSLRYLCMKSKFQNLTVYNASSHGAIHIYLSSLPNYISSEYFPDVPLGQVMNGIRCEDLQNLSFPNAVFDIVISEDVMEHIRHPESALKEIYRVLKKGGNYIFTIPIYGKESVVRVDTTTDNDVFILPPFYHGDPLRKGGALAYNDFGDDIVVFCEQHGFETQLIEFEAQGPEWLSGHVIVAKKL